jgi:hypothetical protein
VEVVGVYMLGRLWLAVVGCEYGTSRMCEYGLDGGVSVSEATPPHVGELPYKSHDICFGRPRFETPIFHICRVFTRPYAYTCPTKFTTRIEDPTI